MNQKDQRKEHAEHKTSLTKEAIFMLLDKSHQKTWSTMDIYIYISVDM